jgi:uncharacterized surface protein with fasciclin (FAS1) repeats
MQVTAITAAIGLALGAASALAQQEQPGVTEDPLQRQQPAPSSQGQRDPAAQQQPTVDQSRTQPSSQQPSSQQPISQQPISEQPQSSERANEQSADQFGANSQGTEKLDEITGEHADLGTFVKAVKAAGLADSLTGGTEYTVFAPTDEAWEKSGKNVDELMKPENRAELVSLLRAHIVADDVDMDLAGKIDKAKTIDGGEVDIEAADGELTVGNTKAVDAESIELDSLRIYAIDGVLAANGSETFDDATLEGADRGSPPHDQADQVPLDPGSSPEESPQDRGGVSPGVDDREQERPGGVSPPQ